MADVVDTPGAASVAERCAAHPSRPARDHCPQCDRPRCERDGHPGSQRGGRPAADCLLCRAATGRGGRAPAVAVVGTAAAGIPLTVLGAALGQEYVGARVFSTVFPALVGVALAAAAGAIAGPSSRPVRAGLAAVCVAYAVVSALLDFRFTHLPFGPVGRWLPPALAAAAGALVGSALLVRRAQERKTSSAIPPR